MLLIQTPLLYSSQKDKLTMIDKLLNHSLRCILYTAIICITACHLKESEPSDNKATLTVNDSLIGKKIHMPDSLEAFSPFKDSLYMDSAQLAKHTSFRVYTIVNVSCSSCIPDIDKWNRLTAEFMKYDVPVILVCITKDNFEYVKFLFENGKVRKFPFPVFLDLKGRFYQKNDFFHREVYGQAVLVDKSNTIVASGRPIDSDEIKSLYFEKIRNS
jgi:hypothetical protein